MIFNRPWLVFLLFIAGLLFSAVSWLRFGVAISLFDFLNGLPLSISPLYQILTGLFWGAAGLWVCGWLWKGHRKAPAALRILTVTYALYYWIDQLLIMTSEIRQTNWWFMGLVTAILVLLVFLSLLPPAVKEFFGEQHEQKK